MISQFSIYTLILGIFDWNPLHKLSGTTDLVLATNIDREICHTINSRQLCLMVDVSIYTNYLMKVYIRFRRSAGCVSCDVILNSNIDKSYCKYKLIGTLLCFLQMNRFFFLKMKVWTESGQPIRQFLIVIHFFKLLLDQHDHFICMLYHLVLLTIFRYCKIFL